MKIYYYVCEKFEDSLRFRCERFSNNKEPKLTDQEIITIYLFVMQHQGIFKMSKIHQFATEYLLDWFPDLGSYQAFNNRLNRISCVMGSFVETLLNEFVPKESSRSYNVLDSMPIITCSGKRAGKVAQEITAKGYCSTKSMYYYGMKLHALVFAIQANCHIQNRSYLHQPVSMTSAFIKRLGPELKTARSLAIKYIMTLLFFKI